MCRSVLLRLQCIYTYLVIEPVLKLVYPSHELKLLSRVLQPLSPLIPQLDQLSIPGRGMGRRVRRRMGGDVGGGVGRRVRRRVRRRVGKGWEERVGSE